MNPKPGGPPTSVDDELARRRRPRAPASPAEQSEQVAGTGDAVVVELAPYLSARALQAGTCACGQVHPSCVGFPGFAGFAGDAESDRIAQRLEALERLQAMLSAE